MEKHRKYMIVLTADGHFEKTELNTDAELGEEVTYTPMKRRTFSWGSFPFFEFTNMPVKVLSVCALFILILLPFHFIPNQTNETYAYVNLDINPSMELEVNQALEVKKVKALNEDAEKLLNHSNDYIGTDLAEVVNQIMEDSVHNHMNKNGKQVLLGVSYAGKQDESKRVLTHIKEYSLKQKDDWKSVAYKVPLDVWQEAHDQEISINKLLAMETEKKNSSIIEKLTTMGSISLKDQAIINSFYYPDKEKDSKANSIKSHKEKKKEKTKNKKHKKNKKTQKKKKKKKKKKIIKRIKTTNRTKKQRNNRNSITTQHKNNNRNNLKNNLSNQLKKQNLMKIRNQINKTNLNVSNNKTISKTKTNRTQTMKTSNKINRIKTTNSIKSINKTTRTNNIITNKKSITTNRKINTKKKANNIENKTKIAIKIIINPMRIRSTMISSLTVEQNALRFFVLPKN